MLHPEQTNWLIIEPPCLYRLSISEYFFLFILTVLYPYNLCVFVLVVLL